MIVFGEPGFGEPEPLTCSRAGCRATAPWRIEWRNPKIHADDRVKVWLACDDHVEFLRDFLAAREFLRAVLPLETEAGPPDERTTA